jgi:hypothetical protein
MYLLLDFTNYSQSIKADDPFFTGYNVRHNTVEIF